MYLTSGGTLGEMPDWYPAIANARYLGCTPWELDSVPLIWQRWAEMSREAEQAAELNVRKREADRAKRGLR